MYQPRDYREWVKTSGLVSYTVRLKESDLFIRTIRDFSPIAFDLVRQLREELEGYIQLHPLFAASFEPVDVYPGAPYIVDLMARSALIAGVGPMASVAGAFSELVGEELSAISPEVIIENGGDNYLRSAQERTVAIYAGNSPLSGKVGLRILPVEMPLGVCTSSGTVGPSISLGKTDATVVVASSAALADAAATAIGNVVMTGDDIPKGLETTQKIAGLRGAVIIVGDKIGVWGKLELVRLDGE
jgi:uncharacterized protein